VPVLVALNEDDDVELLKREFKKEKSKEQFKRIQKSESDWLM
jgi:hypothetical protein